MLPDSHRQAGDLKKTQECHVTELVHKHGLKEGPNKEHPHKHAGEHAHKHAGEHAHSNQALQNR